MTINTPVQTNNIPSSQKTEELCQRMIFHEIRTPLTSILLALSHLKDIELPPESQRQVALALKETQRLRALLNDSLFLSGASQLQFQKLELNSLTEENINLIQTLPAFKERYIQLIPTQKPIYIQADPLKLQQVFINLLTNAAEAISSGEVILCRLNLDLSNNCVWVHIHNEGNPISSDNLPHLKDPFFTTKPQGSGLGLAIVDRIVRAHSGLLQIESNLNGTIVSFSLPLSTNKSNQT